MIDVSDLIGVPFVEFGRDAKKGLDCYGLCIECAKRDGKILKDVVLEKFDKNKVQNTIPYLNVKKTDCIKEGCILEYYGKTDGRLHVAYALSGKLFVQATETQGVRISSVDSAKLYLNLNGVYEVV